MHDGSCHGCAAQLLFAEERAVSGAGALYGFVAIIAALVAGGITFSGATAWLGFTILTVLPMGLLATPAVTRRLAGRALRNRQLPVTSVRQLPPAKVEMTTGATSTSSYSKRRRRRGLATTPRTRPINVGRGIVFR